MIGYEKRARSDRDGIRGGIIEYVRRVVICKRLKDFEATITESKEKWLCMSIYRPPNHNNFFQSNFFDGITLNKIRLL